MSLPVIATDNPDYATGIGNIEYQLRNRGLCIGFKVEDFRRTTYHHANLWNGDAATPLSRAELDNLLEANGMTLEGVADQYVALLT